MASAYVNELEDESVERLESDGAVISLFAQTELLSDNHNNYSIKHLIAFFSGHGQQRALDDETSRESLIEIKHYLCELCGDISSDLASHGTEVQHLCEDLCQVKNIEPPTKLKDDGRIKKYKVNIKLPSSQNKVIQVTLEYNTVEKKPKFVDAKCVICHQS